MNLKIRKGKLEDIGAIMDCYSRAREYMRANGNHNQWINGYPSLDLVIDDIKNGINYIGEDEYGKISMTFAFIIGDDPTYKVIENGHWLNSCPYGTIHRIGSTGRYRGMLNECVRFCLTMIDDIRLDTHSDNMPMQKAAERLGFIKCGIIYCVDGTPRIAYHRPGPKEIIEGVSEASV